MSFPRRFLVHALTITCLGHLPTLGHGQPRAEPSGPPPGAGVVHATRPEPPTEPATARTPPPAPGATIAPTPGPGLPRRRPLTPLAAEIGRLREQEQTELQRLTRELEREPRPSERFALQRKVQAVKIASEVAMLKAQLEHARRQGRSESVRVLQASIEALLAPPETGTSIARSAGEALEAAPDR